MNITANIKRIDTKTDLINFAQSLGLRENWRKMDEQDLRIEIVGSVFDNSGMWGINFGGHFDLVEKHIRFFHKEILVAEANLINLLSIAAEPIKEKEVTFGDLFQKECFQMTPFEDDRETILDFIMQKYGIDDPTNVSFNNINQDCMHVIVEAPMLHREQDLNHILYYIETGDGGHYYLLVNASGSSRIDIIDPELAFNEILEQVQAALKGEDLAEVHEVVSNHCKSVPSAEDLLEGAVSRCPTHQANWKMMCEEAGLDIDEVLYEAFVEDLKDNEGSNHLSAIESGLRYSVDDFISELERESTVEPHEWMAIAEELLGDKIDPRQLGIAKKYRG